MNPVRNRGRVNSPVERDSFIIHTSRIGFGRYASAISNGMKITKLGHCCLLIDVQGARILTDPGTFTIEAHEAQGSLDAVLITHEHADHFHVGSLKNILKKNPQAVVLCNPTVGALLTAEGIVHTVVGDRQSAEVKGVLIEGIGDTHAPIHPRLPLMHNTGYFIAGELWYPGDSLHDPHKRMRLLALPTAGPWMKTSEAIDYAIALHPGIAFPVHDGVLNPALLASGAFERWYATMLGTEGITFTSLELHREYEL